MGTQCALFAWHTQRCPWPAPCCLCAGLLCGSLLRLLATNELQWGHKGAGIWDPHTTCGQSWGVQTPEVLVQRLAVSTQPGKWAVNTGAGTSPCFYTKALLLWNSRKNSKLKYWCSQSNECSSWGHTHLKPRDFCVLQTETFAFGISFFFSKFISWDSFIRRPVVYIKDIILLIQKENWIIGAFYVSCCWRAIRFKS